MTVLAALEADCAERDPGDEHQTLPASQARIRAVQSTNSVMVFFTDGAGHRSVVILSPAQAQSLIDDLIEAEALASSHVALRRGEPL